MRGYAMVCTATGEIMSICHWGDDRDFPADCCIEEGMEVQIIEDIENSPVKFNTHKFNKVDNVFIEFATVPAPPAVYVDPEILALREEMEQLRLEIGGGK